MLKFVRRAEFQGFDLVENFELDEAIAVLTGKNGSGKSRLFGAIKNGSIQVFCNGEEIFPHKVQLIEGQSLAAPVEQQFSIEAFAKQAKEAGQHFMLDKDTYVKPWDEMLRQVAGVNLHEYQVPPRQDMHIIVRRIADKLGVEVQDLTAQQVEMNFDNPSSALVVVPNVSKLFNVYLWRLKNNRFDRLRVLDGEELGWEPVPKEKEVSYFGPPPWIALNKLLRDVFYGKFEFSIPASNEPNYITELWDRRSNKKISFAELSSGEKTLFYITLILFNIHYREGVGLDAPGLMLFDEPDAFLHPSMIIQFFDFLDVVSKKFNSKVVLITHSPSTVALAPSSGVIVLRDGRVSRVSKDEGIAELLEGVTQISISPHNRRQVYVESYYDAECYAALYSGVQRYLSDSKVSLTFSAAAKKLPKNQVNDVFRATFREVPLDDELVEQFISHLNGVGCCSMVEGQVGDLKKQGATTIRGLIDRDKVEFRKRSRGLITVLGDGLCYAIENLIFNPLNVIYALNILDPQSYALDKFCNSPVPVEASQWLSAKELRQASVDWFVEDLLGAKGQAYELLEFAGGASILLPREYLDFNGHDLAAEIVKKYPIFEKKYGQNNSRVMMRLARLMVEQGCEFVPTAFLTAFSRLRLEVRDL
ncbi:ATP-binding protein [Pseudomonas sp. RW3S2]|uniref:ATP-binding protein n=1 Tax=Pseudomonas sp. RW3S2 TaxID=485884 RepID=UPI001646B5C5|nr:ATP-binding protein [Pseudomonas sp. RW3S2]MBC3420529.1 ATP-binding protein [Pseudomonas sp. RW3S2]